MMRYTLGEKQERLEIIRGYVHAVRNHMDERENELGDELVSIFYSPSFPNEKHRSLYVNELNEFLLPLLDLTDEWEADYRYQWDHHLDRTLVDRRRTFFFVNYVLRYDENITESTLLRACHCTSEYYRGAAAGNVNCPEEGRVYVWLRENAEVPA